MVAILPYVMTNNITPYRARQAKVMANNITTIEAAKPAKAYHHGDLREALIAAAREALETQAPETITLKSLAVRLGVSQPAPYRHFESRETLLAAVAAEGFVRFEAALADVKPDSADQAFECACLAYLEFGRVNRGLYRLMFASDLLRTAGDGTLTRSAAQSFDFLLRGLKDQVPADRLYATALWVWATLHGLVMLEAEGLASGPMRNGASGADVVRRMVETLGGP
jgi:AcrR family transcriptional regulator